MNIERLVWAICGAMILGLLPGCPVVDSQSFCNRTNCSDEDPCTVDVCEIDRCTHTPTSDCCTLVTDCDDTDPCTVDRCESDNTCVHTSIDGCCTDDSDCEEGDDCRENNCILAPSRCHSDEDCPQDAICDVQTAYCYFIEYCQDDSDCAVDDPCSVAICDEAGFCTSSTVVCDEGGECVDGICKQTCATGSDCTATDACTAPGCLDGFCNITSSCDDGLTCTDDSCDAATGLCANASNCPDDGLFCNGTESCDLETGLCVSSGDPCLTDECLNSTDPCDGISCGTCSEAQADCVFPIPGFGNDFTLGVDSITGTFCGDTFSATLIFNAPTGTNRPSLQTGDSADGGNGTDTLNAQFNFTTATTVEPTLTSIETLNFTDFGTAATTLSAAEIADVILINASNSTNSNPLTVSNLAALVDLSLTNANNGFTIGYQAAATAGASDEMDLTLSTVNSASLNIITATANGIESLNIISTGTANLLSQITQTTGTSLSIITITGNQPLTLQGSAPVSTIMAAAFTANFVMQTASTAAISITCGSGNDVLLGSAAADTLSGGAGDDTFNGLAGVDTITTGVGTDVVSMVAADIGDVVTDFTVGADKFDWNTALSSTDGSVTMPTAATAFQSGPANTPLSAATTVFELTGATVATQSAANVVSALGTTAIDPDTNANMLFVIYTTGGGAAIWNWVNTDANIEATELVLVATFQAVTPDTFSASDFQ